MTWEWARWQTSRKARRCSECGREIERGERYASYAGIWEGEFWSGIWGCAHCERFRARFERFRPMWLDTCDDPWEWVYGGMRQQVCGWRDYGPFKPEDAPFVRACMWFEKTWRKKDGTLVSFEQAGLPEEEPS